MSIRGSRPASSAPRSAPTAPASRRRHEPGIDPAGTEVKIWEVDSGRQVASFPSSFSLGRPLLSLTFSPDGQALAAVGEASPAGCALQVWDLKSSRSRFTIHGPSREGSAGAVFSPDGRRVACPLNDFQIGVWDAADGKELAILPGAPGHDQGGRVQPGRAGSPLGR